MRMSKSKPLPVTAALKRRRTTKYPRSVKVKPEDYGTPIATLEEHGLSVATIDHLENYGNVLYLGQVRYWSDADYLSVENIGQHTVAEIRTALTRYLRGSQPLPLPEFNAVNSESLSSARNGTWLLGANMNGARHVPWTLQEYKARSVGVLPEEYMV